MEVNECILTEGRKQRYNCGHFERGPSSDSGGILWQAHRHSPEGDYRGDAVHSIMSRVGGFPATLARYLVAAYTEPVSWSLIRSAGRARRSMKLR